jgi:hypothetical protein
MRKLTYLVALASLAQGALAGESICLRGDNIDRIQMTGAATASATDRAKRVFDIAFVGPCGARHLNVYFVVKPENLPVCVEAGTALPTSQEGVCVVKTIAAKQAQK